MMMLNLGCGNKIMAGTVNLDRSKHREEVDVVHDLNVLPWPFEDETFDVIVARAVFEHLDIDLVVAMNEMWRIMKPGGKAVVKLPYWKSPASWIDATHRWRYELETMHTFDPTTDFGASYSFYTPHKWRIIKGPRLNRSKSSIHTTLIKLPGGPDVK